MRSLSVYGLIGAIFGVWVFLVLAAIAVPGYNEYLMLHAMHRDITAIAPLANVIAGMSGWFPWVVPLLFIWVWFLAAGRLHPALARMPRTGEGNLAWAWAAWIGGGLLFLAALVIMLTVADPGFYGLGERTDILKWIMAMAAAALAWLLVSPQAFGRFGGHYPAALSWPAAAWTAAQGALFIMALGLIMRAVSAFFMVWFTAVTEVLDRSMEPSLFAWALLSIGIVVVLAVACAIAFGLLPAFVPGTGNWRARLSAARPALILAGGVLAVCAIAFPLSAGVDFFGNKKLADVAGLTGIRPLSLRVVKFCADKYCRVSGDKSANPALKTGTPITQVSAFGMTYGGGDVPLHPETATALERFVAGKGKHSVLRKSAMMGAAEIHNKLWQPRESFRLVDRFTAQGSMKHGSLLHTQIRLAWLMRAAPINTETRAMLEELSDDKRYFIGTRAAARLAAAWARFGDLKRAERLLARARKESPGKYDHIKLVPGGPINGQLSGQIAMPGVASDGIRVGLFRLTDDPTTKVSPEDNKKKLSPQGSIPRFNSTGISLLADSVVLKADGRFTFRSLGAGDYYLAALIPDEKLKGKTAITGANVPDIIRLGAATPARNLGVIRLTAK